MTTKRATAKPAATAGTVHPQSSYRPEFVEQAFRFCLARGGTDDQLAEFFGVAEQTVKNWYGRHPEFADAVRRGKALANMEVASALFDRARGLRIREQQAVKVKTVDYAPNGKKLREVEDVKVVEVERQLAPDTTAAIFWLKNRERANWTDVSRVLHGNDPEHPLQTATDAELDARIGALLAKRQGAGEG